MQQLDRARVAAVVRRALATGAVAGAALALTAVGALPALADPSAKPSAKPAQQSTSPQPQKTPKQHPTSHGGTAATHDPAGNNGTFFVKQTRDDGRPGNQPHVSCTFYLSFFGFDRGQQLSVTFAGQAPTGKDEPVPSTATTTLTSATPAGGAGNDYDGFLGAFDGTNLDLSKLGTPAKQGYHLKVDVATGQGGGHKYKVFWFSPCTGATSSSTPTTTDTSTDTSTAGAATTSVGGTTTTATGNRPTSSESGSVTGGAQVEAASAARQPATAPDATQVLGERFTRSTPRTSVGVASLPFTGGETAALAGLGVATVAGGTLLLVAGRRRRAVRAGA